MITLANRKRKDRFTNTEQILNSDSRIKNKENKANIQTW